MTAYAPAAGRHRHVRRVLTGIVAANSWFWIFWAILVLVFAGIALGIGLWGGMDESLWASSMNSTKGTMGAVGVMTTSVFLPLWISHGVTRRSFTLGAAAGLAVMAAISAVLTGVGFAVEHLVYTANGIPERLAGEHLFSAGDQFPLVWTESFLTQLAYAVCGWLIATWFYRFGPWTGMLLLAPSAAPAVLAELLLTGGLWFGAPVSIALPAGWPDHLRVLSAVALIAVALLAVRSQVLRTALRPRKG